MLTNNKAFVFINSVYSARRGDALMCDNMDDAPHNVAISPADYTAIDTWTGGWDTSVTADCGDDPSLGCPLNLVKFLIRFFSVN